jgi:hypothetical protein
MGRKKQRKPRPKPPRLRAAADPAAAGLPAPPSRPHGGALRFGLLAVVLLALALANTGPISTNDLGFHLRIGQEIAETGRPPRTDSHSHTAPGAAYPDHEWLTQLGFYWLDRWVGDGGMAVFRGLLVGICLTLVAVSVRGPLVLRITLVLAVMQLGFNHSEMRPHLLCWILAAALNLLLDKGLKPLILVLILIWASTHGSVLLGAGMAGLFFLEEYWRQRRTASLVWAGACAVVPLLNRYGFAAYTLFLEIRSHAKFVGEWKPYAPDTFEFWLIAALAALALIGLLKSRPLNPFDGIRLAVLGVLSFQASRNGVVAAIFLAPLFGRWYGPALARRSARVQTGAAVVLAVVSFFMLGFRIREGKALRPGIDHEHLPVAAVRFMQAHHLKGPIFNDYNFGGYLLWKAWPDFPVFLDGRIEVYKGKVLDDYLLVSNAGSGWEDVARRYGITFFLVRPERKISKVLLASRDWDLVYFDYNSALFVRHDLFPDVTRLRIISPYGHRDRTRVAQAVEEIRYLLDENPLFFGGYKILAFLLFRSGDFQGAGTALHRYLELHPAGADNEETRTLIESLRKKRAWPSPPA